MVGDERRRELIELHGQLVRHRARWLGSTLGLLIALGVYAMFELAAEGYMLLAALLFFAAFVTWYWGRRDDQFAELQERIEQKLGTGYW